MTRALICLLAFTTLTACMTLPGSDTPVTSRYSLQGPGDDCDPGGTPLAISVAEVNVGLNSDRIARRDAVSGEMTYLKDVRWADQVGNMVEQSLARDLECKGFTVVSSHHRKIDHDQLICEVRALNLVEERGRDSAEVGFSCLLYRAGEEDKTIATRHSTSLSRWSANDAVAAISKAYAKALEDILVALE